MSSKEKWNSNSNFLVIITIFFKWEKFSARKGENNFGGKYYLQFHDVKKSNDRGDEEYVYVERFH